MRKRPAIPAATQREILIESGHRCAVCGEACPLEKAHIVPWRISEDHSPENLICLCANCHERADKEKWGDSTLEEYKRNPWVLKRFDRKSETPTPRGAVIIHIDHGQGQMDDRIKPFVQFAVSTFLDISPYAVRIGPIEEGSRRITVDLPLEHAQRLLREYESAQPSLHDYLTPYVLLDVQPAVKDDERSTKPQIAISALPATGPDLFGRERELERLDQAWENPQENVITLVAFGGVGKTALVNDWLATMAGESFRGARRVLGWSAYSQGSKERVTTAEIFIGHALQFFADKAREGESIEQQTVRLVGLVRRQRTLLVLDGIEPLQYAPGQSEGHIKDPALRTLVRELAVQNPGLCVISTRARVSDLLQYEKTTCPRIELDVLDPDDGARLLESLGVEGTHQERRAASVEFGGHALALTLLGTLLRDRWAGDIRRRKEIGELENEITQGDHARRVMDSYEEWLGAGPERSILRMLGLFDRPAPAGAIGALRADPPIDGLTDPVDETPWIKAVTRLRHARLLAEADPAEPDSLDTHPLVREHFGEKLRAENEAAWRAGHDRLFDYYRGEGCPKQLPDTIDELAPLYAAVTHGCAAGRHQQALHEVYRQRIQRVEEFYSSRKLGAFGSELAVLSGFFEPPWSTPVGGLLDAAKGFVLNQAGFALRAVGRLAEAVEPMRAALKAVVDLQDWNNAARYSGNLSELHLTLGRVDEAIEFAERAVDYADRDEDTFQRMGMRTTLADALHQTGRVDQAEALFEKAEAMQKDDQPEFPLLYSLQGYRYCDLLLGQGRWEDVLHRAAKMFEWRVPDDPLLDIGLDHLSLARAAVLAARSGRASAIVEARTHAEAAVDTLRQAGSAEFVVRGLLGRAEVYRFDADVKSALADLDEAMGIATRDPAGHMRLFEVDVHLAYARLEFDDDKAQQARNHLAAADELIRQTGYHRRDRELEELGGDGFGD